MPLKSKSQLRKCWVEYNRDLKEGKEPTWDCHQWYKETENFDDLPDYKYGVVQGAGRRYGSRQGARNSGRSGERRQGAGRLSGSRQGGHSRHSSGRRQGGMQGARRSSGRRSSGCRGFECLSPSQRRRIASKGGRASARARVSGRRKSGQRSASRGTRRNQPRDEMGRFVSRRSLSRQGANNDIDYPNHRSRGRRFVSEPDFDSDSDF